MIKKGLFAVALLALLAVTVQAGDLAENPLKVDSSTITTDPNQSGDPQYMPKGWPSKETIWWPYEICYKELEICQIPIKIEIGMYAELKECDKKKIVLKQVPCQSIGKKTSDFPCYKGCTDIELRSNFDMVLGTVLYRQQVGGQYIVDADKWKAYYTTKYRDPGNIIPGLVDWQKTEICVDAWSADLYYAAVGLEVQIGEVAVTVKPKT